jgi:hypothetical protein
MEPKIEDAKPKETLFKAQPLHDAPFLINQIQPSDDKDKSMMESSIQTNPRAELSQSVIE